MYRIIFQIAFCLFLGSNLVTGQNLSEYRWNNRLVVLISDDSNSPEIKTQVSLFANESDKLNERKLIVFQAFPEFYLIGYDNMIRRNSGQLYFEQKRSNNSFELLLIGLDGEIKLRSDDVVSPKELYEIIDSMSTQINDQN